MDHVPNISIAQRLANEKQLLAEEKLLVHCLKAIREERYACQKEEQMYLSILEKTMNKEGPKTEDESQEETQQSESQLTPETVEVLATNDAPSTQTYDINLDILDDVAGNQVALDLTVPSHNLYNEMLEEQYEEYEDDPDSDDDYEIDMGMFMYGRSNAATKTNGPKREDEQ